MPPKLIVEVIGDTSHLERSLGRAAKTTRSFGGSLGSLSVGFGQLVKGVIVVDAVQKALQGLSSAVHLGITEFKEQTTIAAQTAAAIKSTGGIAGATADHIDALALSLSNLSGIDDELVKAGENVLLSFTNIRNSAGKGNDIFDQATKAVANFAARTGRDVPAAALILGRALEDPGRRVASLSRAGIVFSGAQTKALQALEKTKGILAAQKSLLEQLTLRFGGAAAAAGKTLPGALNILKDRFKDLAGEGVGAVAEPLRKATVALSGFVVKLTAASGGSAKFKVFVDGLKTIGADIQKALGRAIASVDWDKVWSQAQGIGAGLQRRLEQINWSGVGKSIGDGIASAIRVAIPAVASLADKVSQVVAKINWDKVGRAVGPGLATAIVVAFTTLTDPAFWAKHWDLAVAVAAVAFGGTIGKLGGKLVAPLGKLAGRFAGDVALSVAGAVEKVIPRLGEPILAALQKLPGLALRILSRLTSPLRGLFNRLGKITQFVVKVLGIKTAIDAIAGFVQNVAGVIGNGLDAAWKTLERKAIQAALAIVKPFTFLPGFFGKPFRDIQDKLQSMLDGMTKSAGIGAFAIADQWAASLVKGLQEKQAGIKATFENVIASLTGKAVPALKDGGVLPTSPLKPPGPDLGPHPKPLKGITASQRNTFFDNAISRLLDRVQDLPIKAQIAKLKVISGLVSQRLAATKDVTRRLTLEDKLAEIARTIKVTGGTIADTAASLFDSAISRALDRVQDLPLKQQVARLKDISATITARIAATKDVTRKLALEDQLLGISRTIAQDRQQLAQNLTDALSFRFDKAAVTKSQQDDLNILALQQKDVLAKIKVEGRTLDLERQLFDIGQRRVAVNQQIAANRATARNALQFKALGLTATGEDRIPGATALKNQLGTLAQALSGTFLDTSKTQSLISHIRQVLSGGLGAVGRDVRAKVKAILDDITNQLKNHAGDQTKFRHLSVSNLLASAGLSPDLARKLKPILAQVGAGGTVPQRSSQFSLAGGGGINFNAPVTNHFHGVDDLGKLEDQLTKRARSRPQVRRGAR